jgi:hypothetical protein
MPAFALLALCLVIYWRAALTIVLVIFITMVLLGGAQIAAELGITLNLSDAASYNRANAP